MHASPPAGRVWLVGLVAALVAVVLNLGIRAVALATLDVPDDFMPLGLASPVFLTLVGTLAATGVYVLVLKKASEPRATFLKIAAAALVLSFLPDIGLIVGAGAPVPPVVALMLMHVVAAAVIVGALLKFAPPTAE